MSPSTTNKTRADADEEQFRKLCQYFSYRAKMLGTVNEELEGRPHQAAESTREGQSMVQGDNLHD